MIYLTRLNNQAFVLNADLIKVVETSPDTVITLVNGEKLVVRESVDEVLNRIADFHARFYRRAGGAYLPDSSSSADRSPSNSSPPQAKDKNS